MREGHGTRRRRRAWRGGGLSRRAKTECSETPIRRRDIFARTAGEGILRSRCRLVFAFRLRVLLVAMLGVSVTKIAAAGRVYDLRGHDLIIRVDSRWAGNTEGGYYPVRIQVVNRGPSRHLTFRFRPATDQRLPEVRRTIRADQNATVRFSLLIPMVGTGTYGTLQVIADGVLLEDFSQQLSLPAAPSRDSAGSNVVVISPGNVDLDPLDGGVNAKLWEWSSSRTSRRRRSSGGYGGGGGFGGLSGGYGGYGGGTSSYFTGGRHQVLPPTMLPESWLAYSGVDIVAVSLKTLAVLEPEPRTAILQWMHCGGTLFVYEVEELTRLETLLQLDRDGFVANAWQPADPTRRRRIRVDDYRQALSRHQPGETKPNSIDSDRAFDWPGTPETFRYRDVMLGRMYALQENPFPGSAHDWAWFLASLGEARAVWTLRHGISARRGSHDFMRFLIPDVRGVPIPAFLVLMTLFAVLIGPLNYVYFWKRRQLGMLVLTIPLIACLTSLALFGYSAVAHGFGIKGRLRSVTLLDQRRNTAVTVSRNALYAGLAPSQGLRFTPDTAVYPIRPAGAQFEAGTVDWTETQALQSGWLKSRTRTQFLTVTHRAERGRLQVVSPENDRLTISNGLEWNIEAVAVADDEGTLYMGRHVPAGASTRLDKATREDLVEFRRMLDRHPLQPPDGLTEARSSDFFGFGIWDGARPPSRSGRAEVPARYFSHSLMEQTLARLRTIGQQTANGGTPRPLSPGCYAAILSENPGVDIGVALNQERASLHLLIGCY